jgi:hypothetical protein
MYRPGIEPGEHSRKEPCEQLVISHSEHPQRATSGECSRQLYNFKIFLPSYFTVFRCHLAYFKNAATPNWSNMRVVLKIWWLEDTLFDLFVPLSIETYSFYSI